MTEVWEEENLDTENVVNASQMNCVISRLLNSNVSPQVRDMNFPKNFHNSSATPRSLLSLIRS